MTNTNQSVTKPVNTDTAPKITAKIKETWSKLSDDDVKLYSANRDQFFAKLKEKQSVSKEDAEKKLMEIEKSFESPSTNSEKAA